MEVLVVVFLAEGFAAADEVFFAAVAGFFEAVTELALAAGAAAFFVTGFFAAGLAAGFVAGFFGAGLAAGFVAGFFGAGFAAGFAAALAAGFLAA
ncbi:MAG: hypothetical protein HN693_05545, partial [Micrococcales bacterium]|nr:hypothetical protein [Micrococcales bacterium]